MATRLSTRIQRIELQTSDALTSDSVRLLVVLLAKVDALFYPWRGGGVAVAVHQRQRDYIARAEGLSAKADGSHQWKNAHFARQQLVTLGLAEAMRGAGQITSLFLMAKGTLLAQSHVWDKPSVLDDWSRVAFLCLRGLEAKPWCGRRWISESQLFGMPCTGDPEQWCEYTSQMLPLLISGLVTANSDAHGRVYYCAKDCAFPVLEPVDFPRVDPTFTDRYLDAYEAERRSLAKAEPKDANEICIPIPASGW